MSRETSAYMNSTTQEDVCTLQLRQKTNQGATPLVAMCEEVSTCTAYSSRMCTAR
jgi:hypothetical protein